MTDRTDRQELVILRVMAARVAHKLDLHEHVPGRPGSDYTSIHNAALTHKRGWNALGARMVEAVDRLQTIVREAPDITDPEPTPEDIYEAW